MDNWTLVRNIIGLLAATVAVLFFLSKIVIKKKGISTKFLSRTGVFAAISVILYIIPGLKFPLPFFPSFLELHFDEIPLFIAGFAYGPFSAFIAILIRTLIKLPFSTTLCVGELADLIYSVIFIIPASLIYKKHRSFKGAVVSVLVGTIIQTIGASFITTFVILGFYMKVMNIPYEAIMAMLKACGIFVNALDWEFLIYVCVPFNLLKNVIIVVVTLLIYKKIHILIERIIK